MEKNKQKKLGTCSICGTEGELSYEHVPPKKAFNNRTVLYDTILNLIQREDDPNALDKFEKKGRQKGFGYYTLCEKCNCNTGSWYGTAYSKEWVTQGMYLGQCSKIAPSLCYTFHIFPLRVIKQIVCMFFCVNGTWLSDNYPDLKRFVLNKWDRYIMENIKIYVYFNLSYRGRQSGIIAKCAIGGQSKGPSLFSEIAFPPFGYVMTFKSRPPNKNYTDITYFTRYGYDEWKHIPLKMPILDVYAPFPGDHRTREQLMGNKNKNLRYIKKRNAKK